MKFKRSQRPRPEVNLTPLIDVVFLLLIFFMVSTTFTKETQLAINLPEATGNPPAANQGPIKVVISYKGEIAINGQLLSDNRRETFREALVTLSNGDVSAPMIIAADAEVPYQMVIKIMDIARQVGFAKFQMATQELKSSSS